MIEFLLQDIYINAYILRAIIQQNSEFRYDLAEDVSGQVVGLVAKWHHEKIATVRGKEDFCLNWFTKLCSDHDFHDIEPSIAFALEANGLVPSYFERSRYLVLTKEIGSLPLRKTNLPIYICTEQFPDAEHFTVIENGKPVSSMNLERVTDWHFILSKFITQSDWRNQGIGTRLLEIVLNRLCGKTVQLFVDAKNSKATSFYNRFGFKTAGELFNFVDHQSKFESSRLVIF